MQVISIGSSLVDIFIHSKNFGGGEGDSGKDDHETGVCFRFGDKTELESFQIFSGGGASNTAVGFSRLGFETGIISETGQDDFSQIVLNDLKKENVSTQLMVAEKREQTGGSVILVGDDGRRLALVHRGASSMLDPYDIPPFWISKANWIHLSSVSGRLATLNKIFALLKTNHEVGLSWNPGSAELKLLASKKLDISQNPCRIFIVNLQEWEKIKDVQTEILASVGQVVVTNGSKGGRVYVDGKPSFEFPGGDTKSVDDTGAGDAFCCGYVSAQILNETVEESIAWGVRNAWSVIGHFGAKQGLMRREDIRRE